MLCSKSPSSTLKAISFPIKVPIVDLEALSAELSQAEGAVDELSLVVQAMSKDLRNVRELVEQAVRGFGAAASTYCSQSLDDSANVMSSISEVHATQLIPRYDTKYFQFGNT